MKPILRPDSPKKAVNLMSVIRVDIKRESKKPPRLISQRFGLSEICIFLKLDSDIKYPHSQLPKIINNQNFGELKGSCKAELK